MGHSSGGSSRAADSSCRSAASMTTMMNCWPRPSGGLPRSRKGRNPTSYSTSASRESTRSSTGCIRTPRQAPSRAAGLTAVQAVHNLIRAAAIMAEQGPQLLIQGRRSAVVDRFLRRVSLGSARPGSYVLTSRVPVAGTAPTDASRQLDLLPTTAEAPGAVSPRRWLFGRDVVSGLHHAVRVAHDTAGRVLRAQDQFSAFYDGVEHGLSANLCEALSDLGSFGKRQPGAYRAFEVGFGWARQGHPTNKPSRFHSARTW